MKKAVGIVLGCLLLAGAFFLGRLVGAGELGAPDGGESGQQNLRLSFTPDYGMDAGFTTISLEQGNYPDVTYLGMHDVTVNVDGSEMPLEDALKNGKVSVEELVADARQDAALGLCQERWKSENGLSVFTYYYGDFNVRCVYDVYETPANGKQLITDFLIYESRSEPTFSPVDSQTGEALDKEDWGLAFEVTQADSSGVTIACVQSGGQQIGQLNCGGYLLYRKNADSQELDTVPTLDDQNPPIEWFSTVEEWNPDPDGFLTMNGTTELSFDFTQIYGTLPAGDYELTFQVVDCYNPSEVPPLMRNFHDNQWYSIGFSIQ